MAINFRMSWVASAGALAMLAGAASGAIHTLEDRNSRVIVDDASSDGMTEWRVDGTNQLYQQWFWFRLQGDTQERALNTLPLNGFNLSDTNTLVDARPDNLFLQYQGAGFTIEPSFQLRGGLAGSNRSDITEQISINNNRNEPLVISFFQYCDFDIGGTAGGDSGQIVGAGFNTAQQSDALLSLSETVITPMPTRFEIATYPSILTRLNNAVVDDLLNIAGPLGPGDLTWAFQWDLVIPAGQSVLISKDKSIVPAPGAVSVLALGGLLAARRRRN